MLTQIKLTHFKCFGTETTCPLNQFNLLTGINGQGKSTLLHCLLLMHQSIEHNERTKEIILNGNWIKLGHFNDIRNCSISRDEDIIFEYTFNFKEPLNLKYYLTENDEDDMVADIRKIVVDHQNEDAILLRVNDSKTPFNRLIGLIPTEKVPPERLCPEEIIWNPNLAGPELPTPFNKIHYIGADHIGPQDFYLKSSLTHIDSRGELTLNILDKKRNELVYSQLCLGEDAQTLLTQTEAWLNAIFDGAKVDIPHSKTSVLELFFNSSLSKERFKPANSGFGFSYILPIVVAGLIAQQGEILIIENPEAHLHPKAQSRLAKFLARVSRCGVQIFLETHSDHILNALRIAVVDELIAADDLNILYFQSGHNQPEIITIPVQPDGSIEEWPEGFFDQMDKDFERLFGM